MCGIAGIFGKSDVDTLKKMLSTLYHRGPDDEYFVQDKNFCMGARRLSIIDVKGGRQPISNENGTIWVADNGEIYNFHELRDNLSQRGHVFKTKTDTEVIVHAYEEDKEFFNSLNGMFAISIWDSNKRQGILLRDRTGKKPLYYTHIDDCLYFASEIKALLQIPNFKRKINFEALHYYLSYKHVPCPLTIFEKIYSLPPASVLYYQDSWCKINKYWHPDFTPSVEATEEQISEKLIEILKGSVKRRMISDVPIGFFLSGGLDSSLEVALASQLTDKKLLTFTLAYKDESEGKKKDRQNARLIAAMFGTEHYEDVIDYPDLPSEFENIISCFDEPFAGVISTYFLARYIHKYVKVAITGDGADELFGSYLSHRLAYPLSLENGNKEWEWRYKMGVFTDAEKSLLYSPETEGITRHYSTIHHLKHYFDSLTATDPVNRILEAEFNSIFPDQLLAFADRLSMAHSVELRTAYLDTESVEFVASLPGYLKVNNGETKYILKKAALNYIPADIVNRKKEGFIMPVTEWFYGKLKDYVKSELSPESLNRHGLFHSFYVNELMDGFYNKPYNYRVGNKLLSLVAFQVWYDKYMGAK